MSTIVTRAGKGSSLTWTEGDANFTNLNTDKYESGDSPTFAAITATSITVTTATVTTVNVASVVATNVTAATITCSTLIDNTGGQIKFPGTQVPSSNVNTLDDYEEGSWTPTDTSGAGLSFVSASGTYIKIGKLVHVQAEVVYPATANGAGAFIGSLPFTAKTAVPRASICIGFGGANINHMYVSNNTTEIGLFLNTTQCTNANVSGYQIFFSGTYEATA